jgi:hypothetical protein
MRTISEIARKAVAAREVKRAAKKPGAGRAKAKA